MFSIAHVACLCALHGLLLLTSLCPCLASPMWLVCVLYMACSYSPLCVPCLASPMWLVCVLYMPCSYSPLCVHVQHRPCGLFVCFTCLALTPLSVSMFSIAHVACLCAVHGLLLLPSLCPCLASPMWLACVLYMACSYSPLCVHV